MFIPHRTIIRDTRVITFNFDLYLNLELDLDLKVFCKKKKGFTHADGHEEPRLSCRKMSH